MDVDEDDDFYGEEETTQPKVEEQKAPVAAQPESKPKDEDEDLEEGEEEDDGDTEDSDSDIDIITERKDGSKPAAGPPSRYNEIRNIPQRTSTSEAAAAEPSPTKKVKKEAKEPSSGGGEDLPGIATSKIDVNAKPIYEPAGKPITQVNIDEDLNENDKPWRRPGTDVSDYFNYGFDEFTWALYASKQDTLRGEYSQDKIAQNNKKMFEDMNMMMAMGGMPGMPGMPAGAGGNQMEGMPPEMQAMMQQMMASGMDPSQMDPATMFAGMQGNPASAGGAGGAQGGNQGQGFGGQAGFGQGQNQGMGYGYDQQQGGAGGNRGGGNFRGRRGRGGW